MKHELMQRLYQEAIARCNRAEAWHFEKNFIQVILEEIIPLIDYSYGLTKSAIEEHFGVKLDDQ